MTTDPGQYSGACLTAPGSREPRPAVVAASGFDPSRVQLRRTKGWRMPPNTVKVDRTTRWGNPYTRALVEEHRGCGCPMCLVIRFERSIGESGAALIREGLAGKNLACWCALDRPCHADILLAIANDWGEPRMPRAASAMSARSDETGTGSIGEADESAIGDSRDAQGDPS